MCSRPCPLFPLCWGPRAPGHWGMVLRGLQASPGGRRTRGPGQLAWPPTGLVGPYASWRPWQRWEYQSHLLLGRPWFGEGRGLFVGGFTQGNIGDSSWGKGPRMQSLNLVLLLHLALSPSFDMGVGGGSLEAWHHSCFLMRPHLGWRCSSWHVPVTVRLLLAAAQHCHYHLRH